jgi:hypothetical protein
MLHEIKIKKDYNDFHMESDLQKKISREKFFGEYQDYNIDLKYLIENYKTDHNYVARFNHFLKVVKTNHQVGICESILILSDDEHTEFKKIIKLLSSEMYDQLEKELGEKYKLRKVEKSFIDNFFIY